MGSIGAPVKGSIELYNNLAFLLQTKSRGKISTALVESDCLGHGPGDHAQDSSPSIRKAVIFPALLP